MKFLYKKTFLLSVCLVVLVFVAFAGIKIIGRRTVVKNVKPKDTVETIVIDTAKLKLFTLAGKSIDFNKDQLQISGTMSIHDGSDSTADIDDAAYCFIKRDSNFYYKMNAVEMINTPSYYLQADGQQKKIMLSPHKSINPQLMFPQIEKLVTKLQEEKYSVVEKPAPEGFRKISLLNLHHVTCKEYSITFNNSTFKPTEVFIRLTNLDDPLNPKMDKTVSMKYSEKSDLNIMELLSIERVVARTSKGFKAINGYSGYEVIEIGQ